MIEMIVKDFLILWTTIDPIGTVAIFAGLTASLPQAERRNIAIRACIYSFFILLFAIVAGQFILAGMGIQLMSLQIAGGIILFIFGLKMIYGDILADESGVNESHRYDMAVFPLAVPAIATPGAIMAAIVLTDNNVYSIQQQMVTTLVMATVIAMTCGMMLLSHHILRLIGQNGALIMIKMMGMLLAALSVELILQALDAKQIVLGHFGG